MPWSSSPTTMRLRPAAGDGVEQLGLGVVGVLELVDQHVTGGGLGGLAPVGVGPQQVEGPHDRQPEVLEARLLQPAVVGLVDARELQLAPRPVGRGARARVRRPPPRPSRRYDAAVHELVAAGVDALDQVLDQPGAVAAQVVHPQVELVQAVEQHQHAVLAAARTDTGGSRPRSTPWTRVSSWAYEWKVVTRRVSWDAADQLLGAGAQLDRGLAGEREGEHLGGLGRPVDQPRQAAAEHPRLAGARAREHDGRATGMGDGGALLGGEVGRHRTGHGSPRRRTPRRRASLRVTHGALASVAPRGRRPSLPRASLCPGRGGPRRPRLAALRRHLARAAPGLSGGEPLQRRPAHPARGGLRRGGRADGLLGRRRACWSAPSRAWWPGPRPSPWRTGWSASGARSSAPSASSPTRRASCGPTSARTPGPRRTACA